jgi:hypothetical protein
MPADPDPFGRPYRLLVVANEALDADGTPAGDVVDRRRPTGLEVLVVAPAAAGWLERWTSDDRPRRAAEDRLRRCLDELRALGVRAEGVVGDGDSLLAIDDALRLFDADEVLVATGADGSGAEELTLAFVEHARRRHARKVSRVVAGSPSACGEAVAA